MQQLFQNTNGINNNSMGQQYDDRISAHKNKNFHRLGIGIFFESGENAKQSKDC